MSAIMKPCDKIEKVIGSPRNCVIVVHTEIWCTGIYIAYSQL